MSVCLSLCNAPTLKALTWKVYFLVCKYVFGMSRSGSYIKVIGSRSRSRSQKQKAGGLPSIERQSGLHLELIIARKRRALCVYLDFSLYYCHLSSFPFTACSCVLLYSWVIGCRPINNIVNRPAIVEQCAYSLMECHSGAA